MILVGLTYLHLQQVMVGMARRLLTGSPSNGPGLDPGESLNRNSTSAAGKCGLFWQPKEHIVFGKTDTEPESEGGWWWGGMDWWGVGEGGVASC